MEITSLHKYIALNKMANGSVEVLFAGQPCLTVLEGMMGSIWKINPVFAKLVYGANIFEDIPQCTEGSTSTEEAVAAGLVKLHELGAFNTEVDFPEDTYAATMNAVSEEVKAYSLTHSKTIVEAHFKNVSIMKSINDKTFPASLVVEKRSEYSANVGINSAAEFAKTGVKSATPKFIIKSAKGSTLSVHDTDSEAIRAFKKLTDTSGVKIIREENDVETDVTEKIVTESKDIDDKYDKWEKDCRDTHPSKSLKFKGRVEKGVHTTSAEETGEDRSYGVWDHDVNKGHVFNEATESKSQEKTEEKEITSALKKDKKFVSKWCKKECEDK